MLPHELEAIIGGYHGDPFRVLGPHSSADGWVVRAFLPQAMDADVVVAGATYPMGKVRSEGLFEAELATDPGAYKLQLTPWTGTDIEIDDPYRFPPLLSDFDLHLHGEGTHYESYRTFGAHLVECEKVEGVRFAVWAPNAEIVSVVGDFNDWDERRHPMRLRTGGIWELFLPGIGAGTNYKYSLRSRVRGYRQQKADPYGFACEVPPKSASVVTDINTYQWADADWMESRAQKDYLTQPVSIYEVHLGSWLRGPLRQAYGLHASPVDASDGTSFRRFVGLPSSRLLRAHVALWPAARLHVFRRPLPPGRYRRHHRLGSSPLPERRARPGLLRRHCPLRTRRSTQGRASRLGHVDFQLRPQRGAHFPDLERAILAARISHRRIAS